MASIFLKSKASEERIDELVEHIASMQGRLDAQQAALSLLFLHLTPEQRDSFGKEIHKKMMLGYPAWLRAADNAMNRIPEHHLIELFSNARTSTNYTIQGVDYPNES